MEDDGGRARVADEDVCDAISGVCGKEAADTCPGVCW